jgi:hypothetical protein
MQGIIMSMIFIRGYDRTGCGPAMNWAEVLSTASPVEDEV